jgi:nucleoid-associated protein YgaU
MGRETKYLLALLGLLAGVFFGVVSLKLFVPRPPAGAGPDVHGDIATTEAQALVEPPELSPPPALADSGATARPPLAVDAAGLDDQESAAPLSRFGDGAADAARDPFVVAASYETPDQPPASPPAFRPEPPSAPPVEVAALSEPPPPSDLPPSAELLPPPSFERPAPPSAEPRFSAPARGAAVPPGFEPGLPPAATLGETYVAQAGDSWWSLAERAYGDGRLYRALFAWNRMLDPRVSLAPGTRLEIPPAAKLGASWPALMPRD